MASSPVSTGAQEYKRPKPGPPIPPRCKRKFAAAADIGVRLTAAGYTWDDVADIGRFLVSIAQRPTLKPFIELGCRVKESSEPGAA